MITDRPGARAKQNWSNLFRLVRRIRFRRRLAFHLTAFIAQWAGLHWAVPVQPNVSAQVPSAPGAWRTFLLGTSIPIVSFFKSRLSGRPHQLALGAHRYLWFIPLFFITISRILWPPFRFAFCKTLKFVFWSVVLSPLIQRIIWQSVFGLLIAYFGYPRVRSTVTGWFTLDHVADASLAR